MYPIEQIRIHESDLAVVTWGDRQDLPSMDSEPVPTLSLRKEAVVEARGFARAGGDGPMSCSLQTLGLKPTALDDCIAVTSRHDPDSIHCLTGASVCPSWSGAGVFADGELVSVVVAGTACGDSSGVVIGRTFGSVSPPSSGHST